MSTRYYTFTIWIHTDDPDTGRASRRAVLRLPGRSDDLHHADLKGYVERQIKTSDGAHAQVEFGPIGLSRFQG